MYYIIKKSKQFNRLNVSIVDQYILNIYYRFVKLIHDYKKKRFAKI